MIIVNTEFSIKKQLDVMRKVLMHTCLVSRIQKPHKFWILVDFGKQWSREQIQSINKYEIKKKEPDISKTLQQATQIYKLQLH